MKDHIGAMPYLFKRCNFLFMEHLYHLRWLVQNLMNIKWENIEVTLELFKKNSYKIGEFEVEWMHVTHSIIDSSCIAVKTEAGTWIHTGDFKIDHTPIDGFPTDLHRIAHYGEEGVLVLTSDSTNSHA